MVTKVNNSKVTNWLSDIQIEINEWVMTIYEYDGFKISIDTRPKHMKIKEKSCNLSQNEDLKSNYVTTIISDDNYIVKAKLLIK